MRRPQEMSMAPSHPNPFLHHVRHLIGMDPAAGLSDGQLLERFLAERDETAVEALVRRHGPLVFGVCRRVLGNAHAAEDAFQATFLVLMRKAPALRYHEPLGGWLYRVAYRLALRARANEARRRHCETQAARSQPPTEDRTRGPSDLVVALEEELQRLPARYRAPLVLCYLEGKTNEQAAAILGCPAGSMSARLSQARQRLRTCLTRRGFTAPAAGITTALATAGAQAAVPLPLLDNTARAAVRFARAEAGSIGFVSTQAVTLARGACHAMFVHKLKIAAAVLLTAAMLGTGATLLLRAAPQADPAAQAAPPNDDRRQRAEAPEEPLPRGVLARMGSTQLRHGDAVSFAACTPDGKALVTADRTKTVRFWDLATGKEIRRFDWGPAQPDSQPEPAEDGTLHKFKQQTWDDTARSTQAALSADGQMVAASRRGVVYLWETASGKKLGQLVTGEKRVLQLAFAADGKSLLTLGPGQATAVWEVATGKCLRRSQGKPAAGPSEYGVLVEPLAVVSPGFKYLAYHKPDDAGLTWIHVRDLATGKELPPIEATFAGTRAMTFSGDDKALIWDHGWGEYIVVSDVATGKALRRLGGDDRCRTGNEAGRVDRATAIAVSADGKSLAVLRQSHTIELLDLASGKQIYPVGKATDAQLEQRFTDEVGALVCPALTFSADGKELICSLGGPTIRRFWTDTGAEIPVGRFSKASHITGHRAPVSTLALSTDGKSLDTWSPGDPVRCWDWRTGQQTAQREVPASATHTVFAADGRYGFAVDNRFTWCGPGGKKTWPIAAGDWPPLTALGLSPDGALLATRSFDNPAIHLWDTTTGKQRSTLGQPTDRSMVSGDTTSETAGVVPGDLVFSPDGRYLAGSGPRRQLCLWDVARGTLLWEVSPQAGQAIERFAFSANGRMLASIHADRTVTLYEAISGGRRARLGQADPKNRRVYLTSSSDGLVRLAQTRRDAPVCLTFSPEGRYLAVAQHTPDIHLWDVLAGREVSQLQGHEGGVVSLLFAPDGKHLFSGGTDTTALTWDLTRLTQPEAARAAKLEPQALEALWTDLASHDATRAFDAVRKLSAVPDQAVPLIRQRVRPAMLADPKRLARLLADLQSDRFEARRQSESDLPGLGELAEPALRGALAEDPPPDLRQRLERLRDKLSVPTPSLMRDLRAVELLEWIGSSEARQLLGVLADGVPGARLTHETQSAVQRLARWGATP
jgi:RNA polymerase sigma factor (sigma-70 family)